MEMGFVSQRIQRQRCVPYFPSLISAQTSVSVICSKCYSCHLLLFSLFRFQSVHVAKTSIFSCNSGCSGQLTRTLNKTSTMSKLKKGEKKRTGQDGGIATPSKRLNNSPPLYPLLFLSVIQQNPLLCSSKCTRLLQGLAWRSNPPPSKRTEGLSPGISQ